MASNGKPQSERYVFSLQSNVAAGSVKDAAVRQDKGRMKSARTGTQQPAPPKKPRRPHRLNTATARPKNNPVSKRKTVHLTIWIDPIVKAELQRIAKAEGLTVSKTGSAFLEQALQDNVDMHYSALLEPIIRHEIRKQMQGISNRLAFLLARNAFSSEQTRALTTNILGRMANITEEELKTILAMTKRTAKGNLTRRNPELEGLYGNCQSLLYEKQSYCKSSHPVYPTPAGQRRGEGSAGTL
jgi:hypothetical protein